MAEELTAEVRAALAEEVADVTAPPGLLATVRRRHRRRVFARRVGLAVPVLAAAVVAAAVVVPEKADPITPAPVSVAHVRQHLAAALDDVASDIAYERAIVVGEKYGDPGRPALNERWRPADGSSFRLLVSSDGVPLHDLSYDSVAYVEVDYRTRTYVAREGMEMSGLDNVWTADEIQQELTRDGALSVLGPGEAVGGRPTLELRVAALKSEVPMTLWVDATSYLPVRWQFDQDGASPFDITWLPPTPENLAELRAPIPPGFARTG